MEFCLYTSACVPDLFRQQDLAILRTAVTNNGLHDITGFLHRNATHYFQYIEGPKPKIDQLVANLKMDHRHEDFKIISSGSVSQRHFEGWSMGHTDGLKDHTVQGGPEAKDTADVILKYLLDIFTQQKEQFAKLGQPLADIRADTAPSR